jgi:hypothetical protein
MHLPLAYGLGLAARLSDRLTLALDVAREHWSDFRLQASPRDTLLVENGAPSGKGQAVLRGQGDDTTSARLGAEYLWIRQKVVIPFRAGFFYDPEPGEGSSDNFFGFSLGSGIAVNRVLFDMAYAFRTGTVHRIFTQAIFSYLIVNKRIKCHFRENPSGYKSLTLEKSTA